MAQSSTPQAAPPPEGGMRFLLLALSFFIPIVGIGLGIMYMQRPDEGSQKFAKQAIMAAVAFIVLMCLCFVCYFIFVFGLGFAPLLLAPFAETGALLPLLPLL